MKKNQITIKYKLNDSYTFFLYRETLSVQGYRVEYYPGYNLPYYREQKVSINTEMLKTHFVKWIQAIKHDIEINVKLKKLNTPPEVELTLEDKYFSSNNVFSVDEKIGFKNALSIIHFDLKADNIILKCPRVIFNCIS